MLSPPGQTVPESEKREKQVAKAWEEDEGDIQIIQTEPKGQAGKNKIFKCSVSEVMFSKGILLIICSLTSLTQLSCTRPVGKLLYINL